MSSDEIRGRGSPRLYFQISLPSQTSTRLPDMLDNQLDIKETENHPYGFSESLGTQEN